MGSKSLTRTAKGLSRSQRNGFLFEWEVAKRLRLLNVKFWANPWIDFEDENGTGHCAPDFVVQHPKGLVVVECKLTLVPEAREELLNLYLPVCESIFETKPKGIVAARFSPYNDISSFEDIFNVEKPIAYWHLLRRL
jgi:hypothetical protein